MTAGTNMLRLTKTFHTIIWAIMAGANFVAFYFALIGRFDAWFWVPASFIILETLVLLINKWKCPITNVAEKYTDDRRANFDIYLPEWLAKYNKEIFTVLIVLEIVVVLTFRLV